MVDSFDPVPNPFCVSGTTGPPPPSKIVPPPCFIALEYRPVVPNPGDVMLIRQGLRESKLPVRVLTAMDGEQAIGC